MECYYIVISSSHLNKGHFRNIKGVFRGPLTGSKTLELDENTRTNSLESLKANFYCRLCDKQYHKHKEFDNHINSYDHAHKQRLKELKQREFERNVASKLRKNERKQKKYLRRLHKLDKLRRETTWAPGSGPMFKSTTVTVRDHVRESRHSTIVHSVEKEDPKGATFKSTNVMSILLSSSEGSQNDKQNLSNQDEKAKAHKVSFSFAFPKKTQFKLESSAAVFYEVSDDVTSERGSRKQSRCLPGSLTAQSTLPTVVVSPLNKVDQSVPVLEKYNSDERHDPQDVNMQQVPDSKLSIYLASELTNLKVPSNLDASTNPTNQEVRINLNQTPCRDEPGNGEMTVICPTSNKTDIKFITEEVNLNNCNTDSSHKNDHLMVDELASSTVFEEEFTKTISSPISSSYSRLDPSKAETKGSSLSRSGEAFHPVQSKDGSRVLQWPSEMLMYTYTQPSISYSCNPLYFDFRASKTTDCRVQKSNLRFYPDTATSLHSNKNILQESLYKEGKTNSVCTFNGSQSSNDVLSKNCDFVQFQNNRKCRRIICSIKENEKQKITKYYLGKEDDLNQRHKREKPKVNRRFHSCERRKRQRTCASTDAIYKCRCKERRGIYVNCKHALKSLERQAAESRKSFGPLKQLTDSNQIPHAENEHIGRELLRIPTLQIKRECKVWNVDHIKELADHFEQNKDAGSFNHRSKQLQLESKENTLEALCSWNTDKIHSNHLRPETCFNHSFSFKRTYTAISDEIEFVYKKPRLCKPLCSSIPKRIFPGQNMCVLYKSLNRKVMADFAPENHLKRDPWSKYLNSKAFEGIGNLLARNNHLQNKSFRTTEIFKNIKIIKRAVKNKLDQLYMRLFDFKESKQTELFSIENVPDYTGNVRNSLTIKQKDSLPEVKSIEHNKQHNGEIPNLPCSKNISEQCIMGSHLSNKLVREVYNESGRNSVKCTSQALSKHSLQCKETRKTDQTFINEELFSHVALPYQATPSSKMDSKRHKHHQCGTYSRTIQPNIFPDNFRVVLPTLAIQSCGSLYPVQLEQPFCSASVATVQHTLLQHNTVDSFSATSVDSVKLVDPQQYFMTPPSQLFSRTPFYQITVEPGFCPTEPFLSSPQIPVLSNSVLCQIPVPLPHVSHPRVFPVLHSPHPPLIPLHPLY
ncbi:zinc finger protein 804A [Spea bombifrons]|uniref:zinc finger protein 804A n=1 Tax=Spea bombifrons TaxID=233779 RepID=UPI00234AE04F|nr:zinc finger protein 804A [Spea bombifrons]